MIRNNLMRKEHKQGFLTKNIEFELKKNKSTLSYLNPRVK